MPWTQVGNLKGPQGSTGATGTGTQGAQGNRGLSFFSGSGVPGAGPYNGLTPVAGDSYLDTATGNVYTFS